MVRVAPGGASRRGLNRRRDDDDHRPRRLGSDRTGCSGAGRRVLAAAVTAGCSGCSRGGGGAPLANVAEVGKAGQRRRVWPALSERAQRWHLATLTTGAVPPALRCTLRGTCEGPGCSSLPSLGPQPPWLAALLPSGSPSLPRRCVSLPLPFPLCRFCQEGGTLLLLQVLGACLRQKRQRSYRLAHRILIDRQTPVLIQIPIFVHRFYAK